MNSPSPLTLPSPLKGRGDFVYLSPQGERAGDFIHLSPLGGRG